MDRWEATDKPRYPELIYVVEEDDRIGSRLNKRSMAQKESPHASRRDFLRKPHLTH